MTLPKIFTQALEETLIGWLIFSILLPLAALWGGMNGLMNGSINIRGANVDDLAAKICSASWIAYGLGTLAIPRKQGSLSNFNTYRIVIGLTAFVLLLLLGTVFLFLER